MSFEVFYEKLRNEPIKVQRTELTEFIRRLLFEFLELDALEEVAPDQNFAALGTTSSEAVGFKLKLEKELSCSLKTTLLFDYPSLDVLVTYLLQEVINKDHPVQLHKKVQTATLNSSEIISDDIAIIAISGMFPQAESVKELWEKAVSGFVADFSGNAPSAFHYGKLTGIEDAFSPGLSISQNEFDAMVRPQQLLYKLLADAMDEAKISLEVLSSFKTGVFLGGEHRVSSYQERPGTASYPVPLANDVSYRLNLRGPSEMVNTFCTSVYVALHRAVQSIRAGECIQAIAGGINLIDADEFSLAAQNGWYDALLSKNNRMKSFCEQASGFVRSEGGGNCAPETAGLGRAAWQ